MAPVRRLHRLVWGGPLFTTERWSCSMHFESATTASANAADFVPALSAWMARTGSGVTTAATLDEVKFNIINPLNGRYLFPVANTQVVTGGVTGTAVPYPAQMSLVVSTRTALTRGRGHAGRFYTPVGSLDGPIQGDGRIGASAAGQAATSAAQLISALNAVNPLITAAVFSKLAQSVEPIRSVRVGRVLDTMRSRRTSLVEDPQSAVIV